MKKFFIVLSVLAALMFTVAPSQALVGMPDDVPGCDAVWWFLTDFNYPSSGVNTLLVFTNVDWQNSVAFHYTTFTIKSKSVHNANTGGTPGDIWALDGYSIIQGMSVNERKDHQIDLDGDGVVDHWAGYVYFDRVGAQLNNVIGQTLVVNLPAGVASMANVAMKEYDPLVRYPAVMTDGNRIELFSANALKAAKDAQHNLAYVAPTSFSLYPRFMQVDTNAALGTSMFIFWKSANGPDYLHINWWNTNEDHVSTNIPVPWELNFIILRDYIPDAIFPGNPTTREGWFNLRMPDKAGHPLLGNEEWLGWMWHAAYGSAAESWTVLESVHRDVNTPQNPN